MVVLQVPLQSKSDPLDREELICASPGGVAGSRRGQRGGDRSCAGIVLPFYVEGGNSSASPGQCQRKASGANFGLVGGEQKVGRIAARNRHGPGGGRPGWDRHTTLNDHTVAHNRSAYGDRRSRDGSHDLHGVRLTAAWK